MNFRVMIAIWLMAGCVSAQEYFFSSDIMGDSSPVVARARATANVVMGRFETRNGRMYDSDGAEVTSVMGKPVSAAVSNVVPQATTYAPPVRVERPVTYDQPRREAIYVAPSPPRYVQAQRPVQVDPVLANRYPFLNAAAQVADRASSWVFGTAPPAMMNTNADQYQFRNLAPTCKT